MKKDRNVYLKMKTLEEARRILFEAFPVRTHLASERLSSPDAVGRVLSEPVFAKISSPDAHLEAMDGVSVKAESTYGAGETNPKDFLIGKDAFYVNTGHILPEQTDAVIMIERVQELGENRARVRAPVFPFQNVRKVGEDIVATELLFPQNHLVTPYCVGERLSRGVFSVQVKAN